MKKLLIAVAILSFGLTSCADKCSTCTTVSTIDNVTQDAMTVTAEYFGDELDAIDGQTVVNGTISVTTTCD